MNTRPDLGFERLLSAITQDIIDASDEEILVTVNELGLRPEMQGSVALFGVTFVMRRSNRREQLVVKATKSSTDTNATRRRRPKGDTPS